MNMDQKLDLIITRLDEHSRKFETIDQKLDEHSRKFEAIDQKLDEHSRKFEAIDQKLDEHSRRFEAIDQRFDLIEGQLAEHGLLLKALKTGQEVLSADLDGFKLATYKQFEKVAQREEQMEQRQDLFLAAQESFNAKLGLLGNRIFDSEGEIIRLKKASGLL